MINGVKLTLMIGPVVPIPVSSDILDALDSVQVTTASGSSSGFQLTFKLSTRSLLHTVFLISGGASIPLIRVVLIATINGIPSTLIDGVMTNHQVSPGPGKATLTITGEDMTKVMDYIDFSGIPYPAMPPEARVALIIAKYSFLGVLPLVIPSVLIDLPIPTDRIPRQQGTDLAYVKSLADEVGYVFYMNPGPAPGTSIAYWGPEIKFGVPQPALNIDMDAYTNVESLQFSYDTESKTLPIVFIQEPNTKAPIPIPIPSEVNPLSPPLGIIPAIPKRIEPITDTAKYSPIRGVLIGLAKASKSADVVTGTGSLNVTRYGRVLRARQLVGVRGAGPAFDGLYYVKSVTHSIKPGEYKQNFTLARNGLLSTVPAVPA